MDLLIMAKEPVPGQVKTRLCPPCTPVEAAALAEAALRDTLDAALGAADALPGGSRVVLALDGEPGDWLPPGIEVMSQGEGPLDRRLAVVWAQVPGPAVQIGMDTPDVTSADLVAAAGALEHPGVDAVLGPAEDGGWWLIGFRTGRPAAFPGVPMSRPDTGARQLDRLHHLGLQVDLLPVRNDVDTFEDARAVAAAAPGTRFAAALRGVAAAAG